ncbi:hypothetical protein [Kitasatospora sp. NPDC088548]|uniref:hypothetical protein n=1 Tax=Kitasatospora sp. NPDC088548 TaxID=3364075 RepID=UPI003829739D
MIDTTGPTAEWEEALRAANAAAFELLAAIRPELRRVETDSTALWLNATWETETHAGQLVIRAASDVDLGFSKLPVRSADRILAFVSPGHDRSRSVGGWSVGGYSFGHEDASELFVKANGIVTLNTEDRSLQGACAILAALDVPDAEPLGRCLCVIPGPANCVCEDHCDRCDTTNNPTDHV